MSPIQTEARRRGTEGEREKTNSVAQERRGGRDALVCVRVRQCVRKNEARCGIPVGTFVYVDANAVVALGGRRWWTRSVQMDADCPTALLGLILELEHDLGMYVHLLALICRTV